MTFEYTDKRPEITSDKEDAIWNILDAMNDHDILDTDNIQMITEFGKGLYRMNTAHLILLEELVIVMDVETQTNHWKNTIEEESSQQTDVEIKVGQLVTWTLGQDDNKRDFTGKIQEVGNTQVEITCNETGHTVFLDFEDFWITHDIDEQTRELITFETEDSAEDKIPIELREGLTYRAKVGDDVLWFPDEHYCTGTVTQIKDEGVQIRTDQTKTTVFVKHGEYWSNTKGRYTKDKTPATKSDSLKSWEKKYVKGDRVTFLDKGTKYYASVLENKGDMIALDVDGSAVVQLRQRFAITNADPHDNKQSTINKSIDKPKTVSASSHLPKTYDKRDIINTPVVSLVCK